MNQEESEHNEVDGMKKGADSTGELLPVAIDLAKKFPGEFNSYSDTTVHR